MRASPWSTDGRLWKNWQVLILCVDATALGGGRMRSDNMAGGPTTRPLLGASLDSNKCSTIQSGFLQQQCEWLCW
jgi:hypothetical protein